jgi:hypothetical protein
MLAFLGVQAAASAQLVQSLDIHIARFEYIGTGPGMGTITFSAMNSGSLNGGPWPYPEFSIHLAPIHIVGPAPGGFGPGLGFQAHFLDNTPVPGGLQLMDHLGGTASMTTFPLMAVTYPGTPSNPLEPPASMVVGGNQPYGPEVMHIGGQLLLDSDDNMYDFSLFGLEAGGGLLSLTLWGDVNGANWDEVIANGGRLSGVGLLSIIGGVTTTGGQIPEPTTLALWGVSAVTGMMWVRRWQRRRT